MAKEKQKPLVVQSFELREAILGLVGSYSARVAGPALLLCAAEVAVAGFTDGDDEIVARFRRLLAEFRCAYDSQAATTAEEN